MKKLSKLDKQIIEEVRELYTSKTDLQKRNSVLHSRFYTWGWLDITFGESDKKPHGYWKIKENVINSALPFTGVSEWMRTHSGAWKSAKDNDWFEEATAHMERPLSFRATRIRCIETGETFASQTEAARKLQLSQGDINAVLKGKRKSTGGYTFRYVEEE